MKFLLVVILSITIAKIQGNAIKNDGEKNHKKRAIYGEESLHSGYGSDISPGGYSTYDSPNFQGTSQQIYSENLPEAVNTHTHTHTTISRNIPINVPQPVPVPVPRPVPVPVPQPVPYFVHRNVHVPVPHPVPVPVPKIVPVVVHRDVPYPVPRPVPVFLTRTVPVPISVEPIRYYTIRRITHYH